MSYEVMRLRVFLFDFTFVKYGGIRQVITSQPRNLVNFIPNSKSFFSARVNRPNLSKDIIVSKSNDIQKISCFLYLKCLQERAQKIVIFTNLAKSAILNLIFFRKKRGYSKPSTLTNKRYQKNIEDQILQHTPLVFARKGA